MSSAREGVELVLQALIDAEAAEVIGAGRDQRGKRRQTQRNGDRDRLALTKAGDGELAHRQSSAKGASSRASSSAAVGSIAPSVPSSWRPTSEG